MNTLPYTIEACVETYEEALKAVINGAHQIELCANLNDDGLTPSLGLAISIKEALEEIPIKIMIRCRKGNFIYSMDEIALMVNSIQDFKEAGFESFVFGATTKKQELDMDAIRMISEAIGDEGSLCIHKAIDTTKHIIAELKKLSEFANLNEVLTSGGRPTANEGAYMLHDMISEAPYGIDIIAAGRITEANLEEMHALIGARIYHGRKIVSLR